MKTFCAYHPTKPAQWQCTNCYANYCEDCITKRITEAYGVKKAHCFCPKCDMPAKRLAIGNVIVPFWARLPKFFLYPFHLQPVSLMIVLALASAFFTGCGIVNWMLNMVIWVVVLKYSFAALKETANGKLTPPKITSETISEDLQVVFKQLGIYVIIFFLFAQIVQIAGIIMALVFLGFALLSIPAMITVLVVTDSLINACNPWLFGRMAWRIGWGYLLMCFLLQTLAFAPFVIGLYVVRFLPASLYIFLFALGKTYYTIISYHLMGYVLLQYHEKVGWEVDVDDEIPSEQNLSQEDPGNATLNKIDMLIKDGRIDEAIALIQDETGGNITDFDLAERYYKLLKLKQLTPEMLEHGKSYLDLLLKEKKGGKLCEVYLECASKNDQFAPPPSTLLKIAGLLNNRGNPKEAVNALSRFVKANPRSPLVPKTFFLAADIQYEKLNSPQKAARILNSLIKKYPDHDIIPHARDYLKRLGG